MTTTYAARIARMNLTDAEVADGIAALRAEIKAIHSAGSVATGPQTHRLVRLYEEADRRGLPTE